MKKKIRKKLELSKETLRNLEKGDLPLVVGGSIHLECYTWEFMHKESGCPTICEPR